MKTQKKEDQKKKQVPDALGNDERQGKDMPKAGYAEEVIPKEKKQNPDKNNKPDTIGNP